jgi:hypothetical protein
MLVALATVSCKVPTEDSPSEGELPICQCWFVVHQRRFLSMQTAAIIADCY